MKILFLIALLFAGSLLHAQDLTGTWEGEFIRGTTGLRYPHKMVLEIVEVEGKLYGIFDLYPVDTRKNDKPNITYTVEGLSTPETVKFSLIQGRVIDGFAAVGKTPPFHQFIFKKETKEGSDLLDGKWFRQLQPLNTMSVGSGTFRVKRVAETVSDRLHTQMKQKLILRKLGQ